jgi:hypothetical protein
MVACSTYGESGGPGADQEGGASSSSSGNSANQDGTALDGASSSNDDGATNSDGGSSGGGGASNAPPPECPPCETSICIGIGCVAPKASDASGMHIAGTCAGAINVPLATTLTVALCKGGATAKVPNFCGGDTAVAALLRIPAGAGPDPSVVAQGTRPVIILGDCNSGSSCTSSSTSANRNIPRGSSFVITAAMPTTTPCTVVSVTVGP